MREREKERERERRGKEERELNEEEKIIFLQSERKRYEEKVSVTMKTD